MLSRPPSFQDLTAIADALASAPDVQSAFDSLIGDLSRLLGTRVCLLHHAERGWILVAQTRGGLRLSISGLDAATRSVSLDNATALVDLRPIDEGVWTSIPFKDADGSSMVLLLADDWAGLSDVLNAFAIVLSISLRALRDRQLRQRSEGLLLAGYRMARRVSHLGSVDVVCARVVEQVARSLEAERVALALYHPDEGYLTVAATCGYPLSTVKDVRIEPGAWVLGHVFATGRPMLVADIRQMHGSSSERRYRTFSFAATPLFAGSETLGVLCVTDKRDGSAFNRRDGVALRTLGMSATLALVAARSESEVHRLAYAATVDGLTGLFNRPYLEARLHEEVERAKRGPSSLAVLMADIDNFKTINDAHGHHVGDSALQLVGGILRSTVRVFDVCARYGGDEFAILMPTSDHASAAACARRIRQQISDYRTGGEGFTRLPPLTVSIGVALIEPGETPDDLIRRADRCLYHAKAEGKNRVVINSPFADFRQIPSVARIEDESA